MPTNKCSPPPSSKTLLFKADRDHFRKRRGIKTQKTTNCGMPSIYSSSPTAQGRESKEDRKTVGVRGAWHLLGDCFLYGTGTLHP